MCARACGGERGLDCGVIYGAKRPRVCSEDKCCMVRGERCIYIQILKSTKKHVCIYVQIEANVQYSHYKRGWRASDVMQ